jgi:DNA-binding phage protein
MAMSLSDQLRKAIRDYGSVYAVARDSGVSQSVLQRFVTEERDLYLKTADRLIEFFGMRISEPTRRPAGGRATQAAPGRRPRGRSRSPRG